MADADTSDETAWHALPTEDVLARLQTGREGLSSAEARAGLERFGPNELQTAPQASLILLFLRQFESPLIFMLLAASVVSGVSGHLLDAGVILAVVVLNAVVGVIQEWRAEQALEALRRLGAPRARKSVV